MSYSDSTETKGVTIIVKHCLKIKALDTWVDVAGRIAFATSEIQGRKVALISAYAPNTFNKDFYDALMEQMLELREYSFTVGADFNAVQDPIYDRSNSTVAKDQAMVTNTLESRANSLGLVDLWCFFSARYKSFSRIDFLFISPQLFQKC